MLTEKYGLTWDSQMDSLAIEFEFIKAGGFIKVQGRQFGLGLLEHFLAARKLIWINRYEHRWTRLIYKEIIEHEITILMGSACVAGKTRILNPITGEQPTIEWLHRNRISPVVMTLEGPRLAHVPFIKGIAELFEVVLENGNRFTATATHRVLTPGGFVHVSDLSAGDVVSGYDTNASSFNFHVTGPAEANKIAEPVCFDMPLSSEYTERLDVVNMHQFPNWSYFAHAAFPTVSDPSGFLGSLPRRSSPVSSESTFPIGMIFTSGLGVGKPSVAASVGTKPPGVFKTRPCEETFFASLTRNVDNFSAGPFSAFYGALKVAQEFTKTFVRACVSDLFGIRTRENSLAVNTDAVFRTDSGSCHSENVHHHRNATRIKSIISVGTDYFYDIEVPKAHHYFAEGTIHHNSSQKTAHAAEWLLIDYWCHPENTLALVTTTKVDKLESNIFGEIKSLWAAGQARWPWLAGNIVDHHHAIYTHKLEDTKMRDRRLGIMGKACYENKQWVGDSLFVGIKQQRVRFIGDELQYMAGTFLHSWNSLFANPDVKIVGSGNPNHNPDDPLGVSAEPKDGWNSLPEPEKTTCWDTKFLNGRCINLVGTDSPNFDVGPEAIEPYPGLIGYKFMRRVIHDSGPDSPDFYRRVKGVMKFSLAHDRVITKQLCRDHRVFEKATWANEKRTKIYAVDPAYGGGDRCMRGWAEFGESLEGGQIIRFTQPTPIQINLRLKASPEDQIAETVKIDLDQYDIPYENAFYGAFGKGTVGYAFARVFGHNPPLPIEEGGNPTKRPVRQDLRIFDERTRQLRLKRCDEHYSKKITEIWFSLRYAIEAEQVRELGEDVVDEGCIREYKTVAGNKIEVEPKEDLKERLGRSPDKFDWATFILEGARQRGFVIASLGPEDDDDEPKNRWLNDLVDKQMKLVRAKQVMVVK